MTEFILVAKIFRIYTFELSFQNLVVSIEGNMVATDGNRKFTASINNGTDYIAGGILGDIQYYKDLQITVEEDDGNIALSYLIIVNI